MQGGQGLSMRKYESEPIFFKAAADQRMCRIKDLASDSNDGCMLFRLNSIGGM